MTGEPRDLRERVAQDFCASKMGRRQMQGMLRLIGDMTPDLPIKSANGLLRTPTAVTRRHIIRPFEGGTIGYVDIMVCLAAELDMMDATREIHL